MKTEVIDYTEDSSTETEATSGGGSLGCKFVLAARADCLYLLVGPLTKFRYHANLVERFCDERGIASAWLQKPDVLQVVDADVRILGGGHLEIDRKRRRMKFHGVSRAYGVFNPRDLTELIKNETFFAGYSVSFSRL